MTHSDYVLKIYDKSDADDGEVSVGAVLARRDNPAQGVMIEVTLQHIEFYFDDWSFSDVLRAERWLAEWVVTSEHSDASLFDNLGVADSDIYDEREKGLLLILCETIQRERKHWVGAECSEDQPTYIYVKE